MTICMLICRYLLVLYVSHFALYRLRPQSKINWSTEIILFLLKPFPGSRIPMDKYVSHWLQSNSCLWDTPAPEQRGLGWNALPPVQAEPIEGRLLLCGVLLFSPNNWSSSHRNTPLESSDFPWWLFGLDLLGKPKLRAGPACQQMWPFGWSLAVWVEATVRPTLMARVITPSVSTCIYARKLSPVYMQWNTWTRFIMASLHSVWHAYMHMWGTSWDSAPEFWQSNIKFQTLQNFFDNAMAFQFTIMLIFSGKLFQTSILNQRRQALYRWQGRKQEVLWYNLWATFSPCTIYLYQFEICTTLLSAEIMQEYSSM